MDLYDILVLVDIAYISVANSQEITIHINFVMVTTKRRNYCRLGDIFINNFNV